MSDIHNEVISMASQIICENKKDLSGIRVQKDPRIPFNINWINVDEAMKIHENLIMTIGGLSGIHDIQDLEYTINRPLINIVGEDEKDIIDKICMCTYHISDCFIDAGAQTAAVVFLLLCNLNQLSISFEVGEIYDLFPKIAAKEITLNEFTKMMHDKIGG